MEGGLRDTLTCEIVRDTMKLIDDHLDYSSTLPDSFFGDRFSEKCILAQSFTLYFSLWANPIEMISQKDHLCYFSF